MEMRQDMDGKGTGVVNPGQHNLSKTVVLGVLGGIDGI